MTEIPEVMLIQGQRAQSKEEYIVSLALEKLEIEYIFQYEVFGGHDVRGGQVIDFLLLIPPRPVPLFVNGRYWHSGTKSKEDQLKQDELAARTKGEFEEAVIIWDDEFETVEEVMSIIRARVLI